MSWRCSKRREVVKSKVEVSDPEGNGGPSAIFDQLIREVFRNPLDDLTPRELEVLSLVALDMANDEIAEKLGISAQTVKNHVTSIIKKLAVRSRVGAAVVYEQHRVDPDILLSS